MKILFVSHYSFLYGSNRSLDSLVSYFSERGDDVEVLLPSKGKFYYHLLHKGVKVHAIRFFYEVMFIKWNRKYLSLPILWVFNLLMMPFVLWRIKKISPDIIYSNSSVDAYSPIFARLLGIKHIYHVREFLQEDFGSRFIFGRKAKRNWILRSHKLIFVSNAVAKAVVGQVPEYGRVIYNGLPKANRLGGKRPFYSAPRLGVVGNIDISKQQHLAIQFMPTILKSFPDVSLHIVGDKECSYKRYIQMLVKNLKLENNVYFDGFVSDVEHIYSKFDILLMCSRSEAFGRVTIEAMLRKIPVIGLDSGGTSELIEDQKTGFKFKSVEEVINALHIIVDNPNKIHEITENAYAKANKDFSEEKYVSEVYRFVHDL